MKIHRIACKILVPCLLWHTSFFPHIILWDLGGVLLDTSATRVIKKIGLVRLVQCVLCTREHPITTLFTFLEQEFGTQQAPCGAFFAYGYNKKLPQIMCDWMMNTSGSDVVQSVKKTLQSHPQSARKRLVIALATLIFDPEHHADNVIAKTEGLQLLQECAQQEEHIQMILSNYPADAIPLLAQKEELTTLFNLIPEHNRFISGQIGSIKPYPEIFFHVKQKLANRGLADEPIIFIDDQIENILEAQRHGIRGIWFNGDYQKLRRRLEQCGVL